MAPIETPVAADREPKTQYAALPWRRVIGGEIQVLLITSRETRRWVIPKGWPIKGMSRAASAAREAFEEAGVQGDVAKKAIGLFHYRKIMRSGRAQQVRVHVHPLRVTYEATHFPEAGERERVWLPFGEAAERVDEPELRQIIADFRPG